MNNKKNSNTTTTGGIFILLLAVAFITLKLTGYIDWSWLWVLAPIWIPTAFVLAIILIVLVVVIVKEVGVYVARYEKQKERGRRE